MVNIELPDAHGKVISITVAGQTTRFARRLFKECPHHRIAVDVTLSNLICSDCGKEVNPVQWVAMMAEEWHRVKRVADEYRKQADRVETRSKVKCRVCGKMTPLN